MEAPPSLPERKTKRFHPRLSELYLELSIGYLGLLAHELVGPLTTRRPVPLIIDVGSVRWAGRLAVDLHDEPHWLRSRRNTHDEIDVAGVEAIHNLAVRLVENSTSSFHGPIAGEPPLIERQAWDVVRTRRVLKCIGRERFRALVTEVA